LTYWPPSSPERFRSLDLAARLASKKPSFFALLAPDPIETPRGLRREAEPWPGKRRSFPEVLAMRGGELFQFDREQAKFPNRFRHARGGR
jgi:hypothetical protein